MIFLYIFRILLILIGSIFLIIPTEWLLGSGDHSYTFYNFLHLCSFLILCSLSIGIFFWRKKRYLFHKASSVLAIINILLAGIVGIVLYVSFFYLPEQTLSSLIPYLGVVIFVIGYLFIDTIFSLTVLLSNPISFSTLSHFKKYTPYHKYFYIRWKQVQTLEQMEELLQLDQNTTGYSTTFLLIGNVWIKQELTSPIELFPRSLLPHYPFVKQLLPKDPFTIDDIHEYELSLSMSLFPGKEHSGDEFVSGKTRLKIYEAFSKQHRFLRSLTYDIRTSTATFHFFPHVKSDERELLETAEALTKGFTDLAIQNTQGYFPELIHYTLLDRDESHIYAVKYKFQLPPGLSAQSVDQKQINALAAYVRKPIYHHKIKAHEDTISLFVELQQRDLTLLTINDFPPAQTLRIPLGFDLKLRKPIYINFEEAHREKSDPGVTPHIIVAGATASGKSNFIKFIIGQLLRSHTPDTLRLFLVDPKVVTFTIFKNLPHLYAPLVSDAKKFQRVLSGIIDEVERRYKVLAQYGVENIGQLEKRFPEEAKQLPRILVIIDEFADIIDSNEWKVRESINMMLKRLGQKARAAGVHMILITQRATSTNIDSEIKANIAGRIAFRVASEGDAQVIINDPCAAHIEHPGEGYALLGDTGDLTHFQSPYISDGDLHAIIQTYAGTPQQFLDTTLSEDLLKEPLEPEEVTLNHLPIPSFPNIPVGINLKTHHPVGLYFGNIRKDKYGEPTPHVVVAGATNTGKSQFAKLLIYQLIRAGTPDQVRLILVDPKAVSFTSFAHVPHLACPIITKHALLLPMLTSCLQEIERRYAAFAMEKVENIEQWKEKMKTELPRYFIIIDEFADVLDYFGYKERDQIEHLLKRFGQMARAAGVHMIFITQRATSQNLNGELRANIAGRIAFRVNTEGDSHYILEQAGAEKITRAGIFLIKRAHEEISEAYAPLIPKDTIEDLVIKARNRFSQTEYIEHLVKEIAFDE